MNKLDKIIVVLTYAVVFMFLGITAAVMAHCSTTGNRPNSLGISQSYDNPVAYFVGSPRAINEFYEHGRSYTNVSFAPFGASMLDTESLLFCGNQTEMFNRDDVLLVAYRRRAERSYQGVACHEVYRVIAVQVPRQEQ
jgi:hypothetical protein